MPPERPVSLSRRRFLLFGAAGGLVGVLVACQQAAPAPAVPPSPPAQPQAPTPKVSGAPAVRFELWHIFSGPLGAAFTGLINEFQAQQPSIGVNATYVPYDAMLQNLLAAVAAGNPPTAAGMEMTLMARLASENALAPIESLLGIAAAALKDSLVPSIREANSYGGTLHTVPMGYNSNQLYYNPDLVKRAGLDPQRDLPASWDALIDVAKRLTANRTSDQQADVWGYGFPSRAPWILEVRFWQAGAELFDATGKQALFNSANGKSMFDNYGRLKASGGALMVSADTALNQLADLFAAGKVALFEQSSTAFAGIVQKAAFEVGVGGFPTMGAPVYSMGGYNLGIFRQAPDDKRQAAVEFLKWWSSPAVAARWTVASNYLPGVQAAWATDTLTQWRAADPRRGIAADQLPHARPRPSLPQYPQIGEVIADAFEATLNGQASSSDALDQAATKANGLLTQ